MGVVNDFLQYMGSCSLPRKVDLRTFLQLEIQEGALGDMAYQICCSHTAAYLAGDPVVPDAFNSGCPATQENNQIYPD
jgi:hypothetical protein